MTKKYRKRDSQHPKILLILTSEQLAALDAVLGDQDRSAFIRDALKAAFDAMGEHWPDNMPTKGHALKSKSEENVN